MKKTAYFISIASLFLIPFFSLIVTNSFFFPFITGKAFYFRILVEIAFAAWVVLAFVDAKYRPRFSSLTIGVTAFTLIALIADLLGVNPLRSIWSNFERMEGWVTIIHLWAFYMTTVSIFGVGEEGMRLWHRWLNMSLAVAFIVSIYGLFQLFGWADIHQGSVRLDASLGNAIYLAVYMMIHAFLAAYMFFKYRLEINTAIGQKKTAYTKSKLYFWIYGILAVLFTFIVFETLTRGTALGLIGGTMLALALYSIFGRNESKRSRQFTAGILAVIILLGIIFMLNRSNPLIQKSTVLSRLATISLSEVKTQARQYIWPIAISGALERPILGWGQENFNYIFNADYNPKMWSQEQWFDRAHNVYLDWLVAGGFVGLIAYLALYVLSLMAIWKSNLSIAEKSIFTGLLAGYAVHNIFVFDNLASYVFFFAILGFTGSLREGKPIAWLGVNPFSKDAVEYIVVPIAGLALIACLYFVNVKTITANTRLITAMVSCSGNSQPDPTLFEKALAINSYTANQEIREQLLSCAGNVVSSQLSEPIKQSFVQLTLKEIEAQKAATPKDARIYLFAGTFMDRIGQTALAIPFLEKAHELSPAKQSMDIMLAGDYLNVGKKDEAVALLKTAYESATDNTDVRALYAAALVLTGKESDARKMFGDYPEIFMTEQMARVYASTKQYAKASIIFKELSSTSPSDINLIAQLAQAQYMAGQTWTAIETMRSIEKIRPDLKDQVEAAIKQAQK